MSRRRTVLGVLVTPVFCVPLLIAPLAQARVVESGVEHEEFTDTVENWCDVEGLTVEVEGTFDLRFQIVTQGRDQLLHFRDIVRLEETHTANGITTRYVETTLFRDIHVTDNGDGTLTIIALGTGNATLYGPDGTAIGRNPGQVRFELVLDHGGTPTEPSDDEVISFELIKGSTGRNDDFCAVEVPLFT
jgi:hypothetical protein